MAETDLKLRFQRGAFTRLQWSLDVLSKETLRWVRLPRVLVADLVVVVALVNERRLLLLTLLHTASEVVVSAIWEWNLARVWDVIVHFAALLHLLVFIVCQLSLSCFKRILIWELVCTHSFHLSLLHCRLAASRFWLVQFERIVTIAYTENLRVAAGTELIWLRSHDLRLILRRLIQLLSAWGASLIGRRSVSFWTWAENILSLVLLAHDLLVDWWIAFCWQQRDLAVERKLVGL